MAIYTFTVITIGLRPDSETEREEYVIEADDINQARVNLNDRAFRDKKKILIIKHCTRRDHDSP